jgi:hypothetical protein
MTENNSTVLPQRQEQDLNWHPEYTKIPLSGEIITLCRTSGNRDGGCHQMKRQMLGLYYYTYSA